MSSSDVEKAAPFEDVPLGQPDKGIVEQKSPNRRLRLASAAAVFLALVGLTVGLSVGLTRSDDSDDADSLQNNNNNNGTESSLFPHTKSFIDFICSAESISETSGLSQCQEACATAPCCDPFNTDDSCLQDNTEACVNYAKCQAVLFADGPAPTTLAETCSPSSPGFNKQACESACSAVECCYTEEGNCVASMFLTCLDYAPCQNLRNGTDNLDVAPPNLDEACAQDRTSDDECEALCEPASCCLAHQSDAAADGCLQSDFISCLTYASCGNLLIPPLHNEVPPAPDNLAELCTVDNLLGMGRDDCENACSAGECCTDLSDNGNCFPDDPLGCLEYAQCGLLLLTGGDLPRASDNLAEVCSLDNLEQGGEMAAACSTACEPARCCWGLDPESSCADDGNFFTCTEYFPCTALYVAGGDLEAPPENIAEVCSSQGVSADNGQACAAACEDALCCYSVEHSCLLGNADHCIEYMSSGCWRVDGWLSGIGNNPETTDPPVQSSTFPYSKSFVDNVCSPESIVQTAGLNQCMDVCEPVGCCDPFNTDESCLQQELESCVNYAKCQGVMVNNAIDPAPATLGETCSADALENDRGACEDACQEVACCFSTEEHCEASMFLTCLDYAPCQNLRNGTDIVNVAPPGIGEACALNRTSDEECEALCEPASCCVDGVLEGEGCLQDNFVACLTYAPCGGLLIPAVNNEVPQAPDNLAEVCALENILDSGRDACEDACGPGACCTDLSEDNCFLDDPLGCLEYFQCGLLQLTGGDVPPAPENLSEICAWDAIKDDDAAEQVCADACNPAECCVGLDADTSCVDDGNFFTCAGYLPCTVLYLTGGDDVEDPPANIDDVCSRDGFDIDNGAACATACAGGSCCFTIENNCLIGNPDECGSYLSSGCWRVEGWLGFDPPF